MIDLACEVMNFESFAYFPLLKSSLKIQRVVDQPYT